MKHKIYIFIFALVLMLSFGSFEQVLACMCGRISTCERYNFSDAVFIGKAIAIEKENKGNFKTESTIFEITESFSGENAGQIKVRNKSGFSCDVEFEKGTTYLVFASGDVKTGFGTGFCSGNLPIEYADQEIDNLRKLITSNEKGKLTGTILKKLGESSKDENRVPLPNIEITAREINTGKTYGTFTDNAGRYEIPVPAGSYKVNPVIPRYAKIEYFNENEIFKVKDRGCAEGFYVIVNDSRITGKIFDSNGNAIADLRVELLALDKGKSYLGGMSGETDKNGLFTIEEIPAGKYTLSVNYNSFPQADRPFPTTFYPNGSKRENARVFEIGAGQNIEEIVFRLPPRLDEKEIRGEVFWEDGTPAKDVEIMLEDDEFRGFKTGCYLKQVSDKTFAENPGLRSTSFSLTGLGCNLKTDNSGNFLIKSYIGRKYRIKAEIQKINDGRKIKYEAESELFSVDAKLSLIKLTLKKKL